MPVFRPDNCGLSGVLAHLFRSERPVKRLLGCGHRRRFDCRLAHDHHAINRRRQFPDAALTACTVRPSSAAMSMTEALEIDELQKSLILA